MDLLLLFDMDGTLLDSNGIWIRVDQEFLMRRGLTYTKEYYNGVAHTTFPLAARFTRAYGALQESEEEIMAEWMELAGDFYANQVRLKPHVKKFLERCSKQNENMAILTSAVPKHCYAALQRHCLQPFFRHLIFAQELGLEKRDPKIFFRAAEICGATPEHCVFFDDSLLACRSAVSTGMTVIGVYDEYFAQDQEEMQRCCHRYIHHFGELLSEGGMSGAI